MNKKKQDRQCTHNVTLMRVHITTVAVEKIISTYSECMSVALGIQLAVRMCHITFWSVACLAVQYFSKWSYFRKKIIEHKMCVL